MTRLSPAAAAFEGLRVMRREPKASLAWMVLWLMALAVSAVVIALGEPVVVSSRAAARSLHQISRQFGSYGFILVSLFLVVWAMTTVATFRAVLAPGQRRAFYLRLGADEVRLGVMTVSAVGVLLVIGGVPALLLIALAGPIMRAAPELARQIASLGTVITVGLDVWLGVRLSLIAVETFDERRFHLSAYWPLARGRFWYLTASYGICFLILFALLILFGLAGLALGAAQAAIGLPYGDDLLRRATLLGLAGLLALLTAGFLVVSTTLFCACQAYAYREIVKSLPQDSQAPLR